MFVFLNMENSVLLRNILSRHWYDMSPLEVKIFITLYWLADPDSRQISISLQRLSGKLHMSTNVLIPQLENLMLRELIAFRSEMHPSRENHIKILSENETQDMHNQDDLFAKIVEPADEASAYVNDNVSNKNNTSLNGNDNVNVASAEKKSTDGAQANRAELTARQIAKALGDEKNIALYEAYLNRYPNEAILKAYNQVLQTPHHRIKKSPGAYFTFLVRRYGGKSA